MASMLLVIAFLARCVTSTTIIDLSQDWVVATDANAEAALDAVVEEDILAYSLVHGGKIIAEYYRDGRDASDTAAIWSVTKSWTSLDAIGSVEELDSMSWCAHLAAVPEAVRELNALVELYFVDPANDNTGAEEAAEIGSPTALPCFGGGSGETPSSPCPEPRSRNLRGRR